MKGIILASSMAVLASGATMPKSNVVSDFRKAAAAELKTHRAAIKKQTTAEGKAALKKEKALEAKAIVKEEGIVMTESHYMNMFEIRKGHTDCSTSLGMVDGFIMNRCTDLIYREEGDEVGYTESQMFVKPNNGGFPFMLYFEGHGCLDDNMWFQYRMPKTEFGFAPEYRTGDCMTVTDPSGSPMFSQGAFWTGMKTMLPGPYGMQVMSNREAGCHKGKHSSYNMIAEGLCMDEDKNGTVSSWMVDVSDCANGNIMEKEFSDANCNVMTNSTTHKVSSCLFDYNEFNNDIEYLDEGDDYASAFIEYTSLECGMPLV